MQIRFDEFDTFAGAECVVGWRSGGGPAVQRTDLWWELFGMDWKVWWYTEEML